MPWTPDDVEGHTHIATTSTFKELWAKATNENLERTGDEGRAIGEANAVVARQAEKGDETGESRANCEVRCFVAEGGKGKMLGIAE